MKSFIYYDEQSPIDWNYLIAYFSDKKMIKIELTEPQSLLLLEALSDAKLAASQYDSKRFSQYKSLKETIREQIKSGLRATMAEQADAVDLKSTPIK